jgi:hypothetical protein
MFVLLYHFPTSVACSTRLVAQDSVSQMLSKCSTKYFKVRFIGDWVKWKPKSVGKKLRPLADVGTPSHRNGLETFTSYVVSGKSMTNYKTLPKLFALKYLLNFFNVFIWSSYVVLHSNCLLFTDLLNSSVCSIRTPIEPNHQINGPRWTREALTSSVHTGYQYDMSCDVLLSSSLCV